MTQISSIQKILNESREITETCLHNTFNVLNYGNDLITEQLQEMSTVLSYAKEYTQEKLRVYDEYDLDRKDKFNIFETISDAYKKEKFHSDILYTILNPETPQIGKIGKNIFLKAFVEMLGLKDGDFVVDDSVEVTKEAYNKIYDGEKDKQGYVDILITNGKKQAIIFENKINWAPDMDNQLVRYMKYVNEQKFSDETKYNPEDKVRMTVVYLTLIPDKNKCPDMTKYDKSFSRYTEMIKDASIDEDGAVLKYRAAVNIKSKKEISLVGFLENCLVEINKMDMTDYPPQLTKVYIEQYKILLNHLGGNVAMGVYQKKLLDNIYSSKENFEAVNELVEIFKNKDFTKEYINEKIGKHATTLLMKCNESVTGYPAMPYIPNRQNTEFLFIYYEGVLQIGFGAAKGNKIKSEKQKLYKNLLEERFEDKVSWCNLDWVHIDIPLQIEYFDGIDKYLEHYFGILTNVKDEFLKM